MVVWEIDFVMRTGEVVMPVATSVVSVLGVAVKVKT